MIFFWFETAIPRRTGYPSYGWRYPNGQRPMPSNKLYYHVRPAPTTRTRLFTTTKASRKVIKPMNVRKTFPETWIFDDLDENNG